MLVIFFVYHLIFFYGLLLRLKGVSHMTLEEIVAFLVVFYVGRAHTNRILKSPALLGKLNRLINWATITHMYRVFAEVRISTPI